MLGTLSWHTRWRYSFQISRVCAFVRIHKDIKNRIIFFTPLSPFIPEGPGGPARPTPGSPGGPRIVAANSLRRSANNNTVDQIINFIKQKKVILFALLYSTFECCSQN